MLTARLNHCCASQEERRFHWILGVHQTQGFEAASRIEKTIALWMGYSYVLLAREERVELIFGGIREAWMDVRFRSIRKNKINYAFVTLGTLSQDAFRYDGSVLQPLDVLPDSFQRACTAFLESLLKVHLLHKPISVHRLASAGVYWFRGINIHLAIVSPGLHALSRLYSTYVDARSGVLELVQNYTDILDDEKKKALSTAVSHMCTWEAGHWAEAQGNLLAYGRHESELLRIFGIRERASLRRPVFTPNEVVRWGALELTLVKSKKRMHCAPMESWYQLVTTVDRSWCAKLPPDLYTNEQHSHLVLMSICCDFAVLNGLGFLRKASLIQAKYANDIVYAIGFALKQFNTEFTLSRDNIDRIGSLSTVIPLQGTGSLIAQLLPGLEAARRLLRIPDTTRIGVYRLLDVFKTFSRQKVLSMQYALNVLEQFLLRDEPISVIPIDEQMCLRCRMPATCRFQELHGLSFCDTDCLRMFMNPWIAMYPHLLFEGNIG